MFRDVFYFDHQFSMLDSAKIAKLRAISDKITLLRIFENTYIYHLFTTYIHI